MIYFISDTHFNNENIIKYCNRPFTDVAHQEQVIVSNWNRVVNDDDDVYVLGDFIMGNDFTAILRILSQLNGRIHLIRGNHDTPAKLSLYLNYPDKIVEVSDIAYIPYHGFFFVCCHFPLTNPEFLSMVTRDNSEVITVHGHVHDKEPFANLETHSFNVSADVIGFTPVPISHIYSLACKDYYQKGVLKDKHIDVQKFL